LFEIFLENFREGNHLAIAAFALLPCLPTRLYADVARSPESDVEDVKWSAAFKYNVLMPGKNTILCY